MHSIEHVAQEVFKVQENGDKAVKLISNPKIWKGHSKERSAKNTTLEVRIGGGEKGRGWRGRRRGGVKRGGEEGERKEKKGEGREEGRREGLIKR